MPIPDILDRLNKENNNYLTKNKSSSDNNFSKIISDFSS